MSETAQEPKAPEWTKRAAGFINLQQKEAAHWRVRESPCGGWDAIRFPSVWGTMPGVHPVELDQNCAYLRVPFGSKDDAREYVRNVTTEYALSRFFDERANPTLPAPGGSNAI